MPTKEETIKAGILAKWCETHNATEDQLTERAKELIFERLSVMHHARDLHNRIDNQIAPEVFPSPGMIDYLTFIIDKVYPPWSEERLQWDLEFAQLTLDLAIDKVEELGGTVTEKRSDKPALIIPGVGETAHINGSKNS